ncbi:MAG: hypothetical protein ACPIOQ_54775, partial [Promethearchaeia archaeon]
MFPAGVVVRSELVLGHADSKRVPVAHWRTDLAASRYMYVSAETACRAASSAAILSAPFSRSSAWTAMRSSQATRRA